ncbi:uncharacterized protein BT62DRAFT_671553 [Guyanagaster necrorhizus]|uniref:C2H2-type domain-containing protein n=1 Tax=Guyanagaster necrorhizus TaxID=856835 RepID=A0A9P7VXX7_9AGAR|nr:uncharacterized protein BT62DRAFT_671553 [Guyanagaster necrorhizus MCA 3950]KAG7449233.1 hypothetical protein BT62DRAFT_671553 [Guyanagaster necrorhizus MCA 3950]
MERLLVTVNVPKRSLSSSPDDERGDMDKPTSRSSSPTLRQFATPTGTFRWAGLGHAKDAWRQVFREYRDTDSSSGSSYTRESSPATTIQSGASPKLPISSLSHAEAPAVATLLEPLEWTSLADNPSSLMAPRSESPRLSSSPEHSHKEFDDQNQDLHTRQSLDTIIPPRTIRSNSDLSRPANTTRESSSRSRIPNYDKKAWEKYVEKKTDKEYMCQWSQQFPDRSLTCTYKAKRPLMKRHVETVHLKYKTHCCKYCDRLFPQKANVEVHESSRHTKAKNNICQYENCGLRFNDPARLHRHKVDAHGYVPKETKRRKKNGDAKDSRPADYESVQPWSAEKKLPVGG